MSELWNTLMNLLQDFGHVLRIPTSFVIIEFAGTFAFALSGTRLASAKRFDVFGAWIVGLATAIGGGTIRDLMLGLQPFWMTNSIYFICCAFAVLWVMIFGKYLIRQKNTWFIFDTIGLALFNVIGIEKTINMGLPYWMAITMGSVTGAAGGVIRDVLINEVPLIFRKEIYALACVIGGNVFVLLNFFGLETSINEIISGISVLIVRYMAVAHHISLPKLGKEQAEE